MHPKVVQGYIPSSVYLRSSYRTKQYPTLTTTTSGMVRGPIDYSSVVNTSNVKTLPGSPYRFDFDLIIGRFVRLLQGIRCFVANSPTATKQAFKV